MCVCVCARYLRHSGGSLARAAPGAMVGCGAAAGLEHGVHGGVVPDAVGAADAVDLEADVGVKLCCGGLPGRLDARVVDYVQLLHEHRVGGSSRGACLGI